MVKMEFISTVIINKYNTYVSYDLSVGTLVAYYSMCYDVLI